MANKVIAGSASGATALPVAGTIDATADYIPIYTASATATQAINRNTYLNIASNPVGISDSQTLTNKTLTSPTINGATLSGTLSGTYTIGGTPTFPATVVLTTANQTLTNKTLTSPTINSPTITNATISADTITGYSVSNSGTIYGIAVSSGVISTANSVNGSALTNTSVTPTKLNLSPQSAFVATSETTTSTSYTTLATTTDTVTVTVSSNGIVLLGISCELTNDTNDSTTSMSFIASGANSITAGTSGRAITAKVVSGRPDFTLGTTWLVTGLSSGSTTFSARYRVSAGTGTFLNRYIWAIAL